MNNSQISPGADDTGVTVVQHSTQVHVYRIPEAELENIAKGIDQLSLVFASGLFGAFVTLLVELFTLEAAQPPNRIATVTAATIATGVLMAFFGIRAFLNLRSHRAALNRIRDVSA